MADRPTFNPEYEEDESTIRDRELGNVSDDWRKEPGDFMYDAVAANPLEIKQLQINQDNILKNAFAQFATGQYLDYKVAEEGLERKDATPNQRSLDIKADAGVVIPKGYELSQVVLDDDGNPLTYTVDNRVEFDSETTKTMAITCTTDGTVGNISSGTTFIFQPSIPGIQTITDNGTTVPGTDEETDAELWERYDFKVNNPDTGGNKNDYVRWSMEVDGVGYVKVLALWNGGGTVKVVLVDTEGQPASSTIVDDVQTYLDPGSEGLGEGKAPCGAKVTAVAATNLAIDITATVTYEDGVDQAVVKSNYEDTIADYLETLIFEENAVVSYNQIGAYLITTDGVLNYSDLTVNGGTSDIVPGTEEVATLGTVTI